MNAIGTFFRDLFTGKDNKTWDLGRIIWFQGALFYCAMSLYSLYQGLAIDPMNWGTGFAAILAAGGAAMALKNNSEPKAKTTSTTIEDDPTKITTTTVEGEVV